MDWSSHDVGRTMITERWCHKNQYRQLRLGERVDPWP